MKSTDRIIYQQIAEAVDQYTNPKGKYPNLSPAYLWIRNNIGPVLMADYLPPENRKEIVPLKEQSPTTNKEQ